MKKLLAIPMPVIRASAGFVVTWFLHFCQRSLVDSRFVDQDQGAAFWNLITFPIASSLGVFAAMLLMGWKWRHGITGFAVFVVASALFYRTQATNEGNWLSTIDFFLVGAVVVAAIPGIAAYIGIGDLDYVKRKRGSDPGS